jgi:hypothetical protein
VGNSKSYPHTHIPEGVSKGELINVDNFIKSTPAEENYLPARVKPIVRFNPLPVCLNKHNLEIRVFRPISKGSMVFKYVDIFITKT